jgi:hypothetical protein
VRGPEFAFEATVRAPSRRCDGRPEPRSVENRDRRSVAQKCDDCSINRFIPIGRSVMDRIICSASAKSHPYTYVKETGWPTPMPPALETAVTSSGLLHGYIGPQMIGRAIPASRVRRVARPEKSSGVAAR